jgi:2-oxo-3-hexenedioate decarboxylase
MRGTRVIAAEIAAAYRDKQQIPTPSSHESGLDLVGAYAVEHELMHLRQAEGHRTVGRKVGFANKAMWRALKLDTLVWAHMYDDTVRHAAGNTATLSIAKMVVPKIEPEIVFRLKTPLNGAVDAEAVLAHVESIALGFEIIDCVYPDWKFTPIDFVAAYGLHAGLIVGSPIGVTDTNRASLAERLATFTIALQKNGETVAQGAGKNSLKNPALCLGELGLAIAKQGDHLAPGEYVSSGTLTEAQFLSPGQTYTAVVEGIDLPALSVRIEA